jgi:Glycosyl hydrolase family 92 catalytic domain
MDRRSVCNAIGVIFYLLWLISVFDLVGDKWAYSFDVVHDIPGLIQKRGGNESFVKSLDEHFDGGHSDHTNEVRAPHHFKSSGLLTILSSAIAPYTTPVRTCRGNLQNAGTRP